MLSIGMCFGYLTLLKMGPLQGPSTVWLCQCNCGVNVVVSTRELTSGRTRHCGCRTRKGNIIHGRYSKSNKKPPIVLEDLSGRVFGELTVVERVNKVIKAKCVGRAKYLCKCSCGTTKIVLATDLKRGKTKSCGCLRFRNVASYKDFRKTPEYKQWRNRVLQRFDYMCAKCGSRHFLNVHHLEDFENNPELRIEDSNGAVLCIVCHKAFHKRYGRGRTHAWQYKEFVSGSAI